MTMLAEQPLATAPTRRTPKRWTKAEFTAAVDRGWFQKARIYLYRGELVEMPPTGGLHLRAITRLGQWLFRTFDPLLTVRIQTPFELPDESLPDPASPTGHRYGEHRVYAANESLSPLSRPDVSVAVATLVDVA